MQRWKYSNLNHYMAGDPESLYYAEYGLYFLANTVVIVEFVIDERGGGQRTRQIYSSK